MAYVKKDENEHGTEVAVYLCDVCGDQFTVCPSPSPSTKWPSVCQAPECDSYDPRNDMDVVFGDHQGFLRWCRRKGIDPASASGALTKSKGPI